MLNLVLFAACEKVILEANGVVSLITLIEKMVFFVPHGIELPEHAAFPMRLQSIAMWSMDEPDLGKYEQMIDIAAEDGTTAMHTEPVKLETQIPGRTNVKIVSTLTAVPFTDGRLSLRLFHRKIGEPGWTQDATYRVDVALVREAAPVI